MIDFLRSTWLIARTHFLRTALSKRMGLCLLAALGPATLVLAIQVDPEGPPAVELVMYPGWFILLQVVVPVLALLAGSSVVTEEIDDRTITYLFTRPIPRAAVLLGRWATTALVLCAILALSVALLVLAARQGGDAAERAEISSGVVLPLLWMAILGGAVYSAIFAAAGTFLKHPMIVGLAYAFTVEGFLSNLPGKSQALTVQFYLRSYVAERGDEVWRKIEPLREGTFDPADGALRTLIFVLAAALIAGSVTISRRQYVLTS